MSASLEPGNSLTVHPCITHHSELFVFLRSVHLCPKPPKECFRWTCWDTQSPANSHHRFIQSPGLSGLHGCGEKRLSHRSDLEFRSQDPYTLSRTFLRSLGMVLLLLRSYSSEQKVSNTRASCGYGQEKSLGPLCLSSLLPQPRSSCSTLVFNTFASLHWRAWVHCGTRCPVGN